MKSGVPEADWSPAAGEKEQLRRWNRMPFRFKLKALEEMGDLGNFFLKQRQREGLPYMDPDSGEVVRGKN